MAVEPYTVAAFVVSVASLGVVGIVGEVGRRFLRYVEEARDEAQAAHKSAEKALRVLTGEDGVDDDGLVDDVQAHRRALVEAEIYPRRATDGGDDDA